MHLSGLRRSLLAFLALALVHAPGLRGDLAKPAAPPSAAATTPEALQDRLLGKTVYLRGFYLDDHLTFDTAGKVEGSPARGSFTLSAIEVKRVRITKHAMLIEGNRLGLHFFGALPYEDDSKPFEQLRISKKPVEITIERVVIEPEKKKKKEKGNAKTTAAAKPAANGNTKQPSAPATAPAAADEAETDNSATDTVAASPAPASTGSATTAAASPAHRDPKESYILLSEALDKIFAKSLDASVISTLPSYWQDYFAGKNGKVQTVAANDGAVLRPGNGVVAPHLLTRIDPDSNDYAQKNNIAGMILLQLVVGADGRPGQVALVRPIGFGLDEKAVEAVERSHFRPGTQEGKAVPVLVNLDVTFRIYSERTRPKGVPPPQEVAPTTTPTQPANHRETGTAVAAATVRE